jgi:hypothetical protein
MKLERIYYNPVVREDVLSLEGKTEQDYLDAVNLVKVHILNSIRSERTRLLSESDWTQYNDSPLTQEQKTQWATYRQQLRDITDSIDFSQSKVFDETFFPQKPQ